jgi:hypothetical protein
LEANEIYNTKLKDEILVQGVIDLYFIDKDKIKDLTVPIIPFSKIDEFGAGMYKGEKMSREERNNLTK